MEGAVTAAGDMAAVDILEDSLGVALPVDFLVVIEDLVNFHHPAVLGVMAEEDIEVATAGDIIEVATAGDITEVMFRDILMEDITIPEDIMEVIIGTTIEDMPHMEQPSGFFLVG